MCNVRVHSKRCEFDHIIKKNQNTIIHIQIAIKKVDVSHRNKFNELKRNGNTNIMCSE